MLPFMDFLKKLNTSVMNNAQILKSAIVDQELEKYWSEINTKAIRIDQLQASRNVYLKLMALHIVKKEESLSDRRIANVLNSFLT